MITLTDSQQEIYDDIVNNIHHYRGRYETVLKGYAGTGKSTLISQIINDMSDYYSIATTSPTHKANAVLRDMIAETDANMDQVVISTIHSFLGLKLVYKKNKQVLVHDPRSDLSNRHVDILIIDECSMISENLFKHIIEQSHRVRRAIIFVGDPCQLPPVETENLVDEGNLSPTFGIETQYVLTEVLRQALDNPIIRVATEIRECIGTFNNPIQIIDEIDDTVETIVNVPDDDTFLTLYKEYVDTTDRNQLFDNVFRNKIISYTNNNVNLYNRLIRNWIITDNDGVEFVKGEPIVFETVTQNCPFTVQEMIQCPELKKESFMGIDCWQMKLSGSKYILVVGPDSVIAYNKYMDDLVIDINAGNKNPITKRPYTWQDYYIIKEKINVINYPYAITVHKSQGSTFDNLWFDTSFINRIRDHDTMCRITYTAMTRPKHMVMFK